MPGWCLFNQGIIFYFTGLDFGAIFSGDVETDQL